MDFSKSVNVDMTFLENKKKKLFFPAFFQNKAFSKNDIMVGADSELQSYFSGIEMYKEHLKCLSRISFVKDLKSLPILLTMQIPLNSNTLYKQLMWPGSTSYYTVPSTMPKKKTDELLTYSIMPVAQEDIDYSDPIFHLSSDKNWIINGYAKDNSHINPDFPMLEKERRLGEVTYVDAHALLVNTDLMVTKPKWHTKGSAFIAKGILYNGGVMFALLNGNNPAGRAIVTNSGKFNVIFEVPHDGFYTVGVANYLAYYNTMENRLLVQGGWFEK